ncbi:MAG: hypothetical protein KBS77_06415 [Bacteroidales bacterium]|nr:hypothetical protein [Candidatus Colicola faecequi]
MKNNKLIIKEDWNNDGVLIMTNACTVQRYKELRDSQYKMTPAEQEGIFFAFDEDGFKEGTNRINKHKQEGDVLVRCRYGMFGFKRCIEAHHERIANIEKQIAEECDPQEVYCYEYNNHECMYDWDGDTNAYEIVEQLFGKEVAGTIRRWNVMA